MKATAFILTIMLWLIQIVASPDLSSRVAYAAPATSTYVGAIIYTDTTWTATGSPYYVIGNVQVPSGVTLTIEPGVTVRFLGAYELLVKGRILANGTDTAPITLTTEGGALGATLLRFVDTNLALSQLSYIKLQEASQALQLGTGNTGNLTLTAVEINNSAVHTAGGTSANSLILSHATISGTLVQGDYPSSGPIVIQNATITNSRLTSDSYAQGITLQDATVSQSVFSIGCCSAKIRLDQHQTEREADRKKCREECRLLSHRMAAP